VDHLVRESVSSKLQELVLAVEMRSQAEEVSEWERS
jgi:hypothetical protein